MTFKRAILWVFLAATALSILLLAFPAFAHGEHDWMRKYSNGSYSCCDEKDIVYVPHWEADRLNVGDVYMARFPSGPTPVTILKIYPTEDEGGRAAVSKWGCLFRSFGL